MDGMLKDFAQYVTAFLLMPPRENRSFKPPLTTVPSSKASPETAVSVLIWSKIILRCSKLLIRVLQTLQKGQKPTKFSKKEGGRGENTKEKGAQNDMKDLLQDNHEAEYLKRKGLEEHDQETSQTPEAFRTEAPITELSFFSVAELLSLFLQSKWASGKVRRTWALYICFKVLRLKQMNGCNPLTPTVTPI